MWFLGLLQLRGGAREADRVCEGDCADEVSFLFSDAGDRRWKREVWSGEAAEKLNDPTRQTLKNCHLNAVWGS